MRTATHLRSPTYAPSASAGGPSSGGQAIAKPKASEAWRRRNGEANALAGYLYKKLEAGGRRLEGDNQNSSIELPASSIQNYQKQLILEAAKQLGLRNWDGEAITSRRELSPEQYGQVITALRGMIEALGLPGPEAERDKRQAGVPAPLATTSQWRQITLLRDRLGKERGWTEPHFKNWLKSRLKLRSLRGLTSARARSLIFGMEGVLRHAKRDGTTDEHR